MQVVNKMAKKPLFALGMVMATPAALDIPGVSEMIPSLLNRHATGDWGQGNGGVNDWAVENGERILSSYRVNGSKVLVITEGDRSVTTILTPGE